MTKKNRYVIHISLPPTMYEDLKAEVNNDGSTTISEFCRDAISQELRNRGLRRKIRQALGWRSEITLADVIIDLAREKGGT